MSRFGASRGVPDYDSFRTGLTYYDVYQMAQGRRWRRRGGVLGLWNQLKRELYYQATGVALVVALLFGGCGTIDAVPVADASMVEVNHVTSMSDAGADGPAVATDGFGTIDGDRGAMACAWSAMPHEVRACSDGATADCHYLDSVGRPDGWLTGCSIDGLACTYPPCQ